MSKYLAKHLRHQPERIGIRLDPNGWVSVDELLGAAARHGFPRLLFADSLRLHHFKGPYAEVLPASSAK